MKRLSLFLTLVLIVGTIFAGNSGAESAIDIEELKAACDKGDALYCKVLGDTYRQGDGVKRDAFQAVVFYRMACEGGDAGGCVGLGLMYAKGHGVKQDKVQAAELFRKSCDLKSHDGCDNYAKLKKR